MTLETQYKNFIKENPIYSNWTFEEWLKYHGKEIKKAIEKVEQHDKDFLENYED